MKKSYLVIRRLKVLLNGELNRRGYPLNKKQRENLVAEVVNCEYPGTLSPRLQHVWDIILGAKKKIRVRERL